MYVRKQYLKMPKLHFRIIVLLIHDHVQCISVFVANHDAPLRMASMARLDLKLFALVLSYVALLAILLTQHMYRKLESI